VLLADVMAGMCRRELPAASAMGRNAGMRARIAAGWRDLRRLYVTDTPGTRSAMTGFLQSVA
jgi:hypothetical protein